MSLAADVDTSVHQWLLEGDPAIRWQVLRDLDGAPEDVWRAEQQEVANRGWGAELLSHRDPAGTWGGGLYTPKWTSTTYTLLLLARMGLPAVPAAAEGATLLLDRGLAADGGISFAARRTTSSETCITGMVLYIAQTFVPGDGRIERLIDYALAEQMPDGGWNCMRASGATHASLHTTIGTLEGLQAYVDAGGPRAREVADAAGRGREFLLAHRMYRSHRTGKVIDPRMTRFSFPPRWHYDVLRGLDHLQAAGVPRDERCADAIDLVRSRAKGGRWPAQNRWHGREFFALEEPRRPSRWNTLRALRVLRWWEGAPPPA